MAEPSLGPVSGGTRVMLTGAALDVGGAGIECIFGSARVAAVPGKGKALVCTAPRSASPGVVEMRLADASSGTRIGKAAQFEYHVTPRVDGVRPSRGALTGGTAVSVTGSGFRDDDGLRCRFGETGVVSAGAGARWVSSTVVMCVAPGAVGGEAVQVALEVSANGGADFTRDGMEFLYEAGATVEGLMPSWGVSGRGGQVVTVSGRHFAQSGELSCRFGLDGSSRGQYVSSTLVRCKAPERGAGTVTVTVSNNGGLDARTGQIAFEYKAGLSVRVIRPSHGPVTGGTSVTLIGAGMQHGVVCKFGDLSVSASVVDSFLKPCLKHV